MPQFFVRFNRSESFVHTQSSAGFTIITSGFEFSVHTGLWHLSDLACRNPRRTRRKLAAEENWPQRICLRRANALRGRWRRATPTNGPAVAAQSSMPAAVQLPPHLSCPSSGESFPADDTVQLRKTFRLLLRPFE